MKNLYIWIVAAMVCIGILPAAAQDAEVSDINFSVFISNVEGITCRMNYSETVTLKDGLNEFSIPNGTNITFSSTLPWKITGVKDKNGVPVTSYYGGSDWYLYVNPSIADEAFTIDVINIDEFRTGQFTINVDDPSMVNAVLQGYYQTLSLEKGENTVKFDPAMEGFLQLSPTNYDVPLYSVKKDGADLSPEWGTSYTIPLEEGCVIDIVAVLPDIDCTVNFSYSEGAESAITVKLNGEPVADFDGKTLVAKIGSKITIEGSSEYKYEAVSINGENAAFWGNSHNFVVIKDTEVYIDAHPWANITATIVVNHPDFITITRDGNTLELKEGENVFEFPENASNISWTVDPMAILNSVSVNGGSPLYSSQTYYTLYDNDVITFDLQEKVFDKKFMVWIDNVEAPVCGNYIEISSQTDRSFTFGNSNNSWNPQKDFDNGYTLINFYQALNPFAFGWGYDYSAPKPEYFGQIYINDSRIVSAYGEESTYFTTQISDGDVVKMFLAAAPVECKVAFDIPDGVEASVVKDVITAVENPAEGFTCFAGTQVVVSGDNLEVKVNGNAVAGEKDEDGVESFTFTVADAETTVALAKAGGTGVDAVEAEADSAVFNMQGVKVGTKADLRNLAPGIYIVAGKKVVVTD